MGQIKQIGTFRFNILESGVTKTSTGLARWEATLQAYEAYDDESGEWVDYSSYEDNEIKAFLCLFGKQKQPLLNAKQLLKAVDWDGRDLAELDQMDLSEVQIQGRVGENDYNDKITLQNEWIDHVDAAPGGQLQRLDADELKKLNAKFASGLRELGGGPKPKSAPPAAPKPAASKPAAPAPVVDAKAEAKAKYDKKKEQGKAAEKKAAEVEAKQGKPVAPPIPVPAAKSASVQEKYGLPAACTQEEAWEACAKHRKDDISDDDLANIWTQTIGDSGDEEAIGDHWYKVRDGVLELVGK